MPAPLAHILCVKTERNLNKVTSVMRTSTITACLIVLTVLARRSQGMTATPPSSGSVAGGGAVDGTLSPDAASLAGLAPHDPLLDPTSVNLGVLFSPLDGTGAQAPQNGTGSTNSTLLGRELTTPGAPSILDLVNMISGGVQVAADSFTTNTPTGLLGGGGGAANSVGGASEPNILYSIFGNLGASTSSSVPSVPSIPSTSTAVSPSGGMSGGLLGATPPSSSPAPGIANPNILADLVKSIGPIGPIGPINPIKPNPERRPDTNQSNTMQQMMMLMMLLREGAIEL